MNLPESDRADAVHLADSADAIGALQNGRHVLCDPPMALSVAGCEQLLVVAAERRRILMAAHTLRFRPEYQRLKSFVASRDHGPIQTATFIRHSGLPAVTAGGSLLKLLIHDIDQALLLFGVPSQVNCKAFAGTETAMATLVYSSGPEVRIQGGWFAMPLPLTESFQVRAASAELSFSREGLWLNDSVGQRHALDIPPADARASMIEYFNHCCRTGEPPAECSPESSALAVRVALLLKQSRDMGGQPLECRI